MQDNNSDIEASARYVIASANIKSLPGFRPFVLVPPDFNKLPLEPEWLEPLPDHIRQAVALAEMESFIRYVKQFKTFSAQIFANANDVGAKLTAILDYHETGKESKPHHGKHIATYAPEYSPDFKAWCAINGKPMSQNEFLDFIRKWGDTITSHSDADMLELASSLDFKVDAQFSSHVERMTGGRKLAYDEKVEGTGQMRKQEVKVPDSMELDLPVFVGGMKYEIGVELLYRPQGGQLKIGVELKRPHIVVRQAIKDIIEDVKQGTEVEPFFGSVAS